MNLVSTTTPCIRRICQGVYKVSPYGPTQPDLEAIYTATRAEADDAARRSVIAAHTGLAALQAQLDDLRQYLLSPKFHADATVLVSVSVRDVLTRLEQLRTRADEQGRQDAEALISGRYPQAG